MVKSTLVHAMPARFTSLISTPTPSSDSVAGSARNHAGSNPTPMSAPSVMSPEMPLKGWRIATVMSEPVGCATAGVEHNNLGVRPDALVGRHLLEHGQCAAALGRRVDAGLARDPRGAGKIGRAHV